MWTINKTYTICKLTLHLVFTVIRVIINHLITGMIYGPWECNRDHEKIAVVTINQQKHPYPSYVHGHGWINHASRWLYVIHHSFNQRSLNHKHFSNECIISLSWNCNLAQPRADKICAVGELEHDDHYTERGQDYTISFRKTTHLPSGSSTVLL